jgi:hypothetical protein
MLNRQTATPGEIEEMVKLLKKDNVKNLDYSRDDEDDLGFVRGNIGKVIIEFQDRNEPCFVSFVIDRDSYDVAYPKGELKEQLQKLTNKAKDNRMYGKTFAEKIKSWI